MKKVTWPTRQELVESTLVVMISVAMLTIFIGMVDFVLSRLISVFLR
jgi:preprotein translocase subunit SecE